MTRQCRRHGFTLIELMLAMAFVSVLLLAIATIAIQAGKLYNRGLTLKSINQSGREIGDILRRDFLQANAGKISGNTGSAVVNYTKLSLDCSAWIIDVFITTGYLFASRRQDRPTKDRPQTSHISSL